MHILVVDDDSQLRSHIRRGLAERGIQCSEAADGDQALRALAERRSGFDLILLDVMLPARSGWDLLQAFRREGHETPVIFVSALDAVEERVKGLQLGADDYVVKPFNLDELVARIETVIRRATALVPVSLGEIKLDIARRPSPPADVRVQWRTLLGVACPFDVEVVPPATAPPVAGAALLSARRAHGEALAAAARVAVCEGALRRIDAELRATSLRRNAVQHRWIPAHEEALAALELTLEEVEREDGVRVRWAAGRGA